MADAARAGGLVDIAVDEEPVDVGVTTATQLVAYRFGQAQFGAWLARIGETSASVAAEEAAAAARPHMQPYRPIVVFLAARVAA
jgi:hypothetical protein